MLNEIFQAFLITSFAGAVLTLLLALLKPVTKKLFSYSWQYYVWLGVLVVLLIPIRLSLPERENSDNEDSTVNAHVTVQNENLLMQNGQPSVSEQLPNSSQESLTPNLPDDLSNDIPVYTPGNSSVNMPDSAPNIYQTTLPDIPAGTEYNSSGTMPDTPANSLDTPANSFSSTADNTASSPAVPSPWQKFSNAAAALWAAIADITPVLSVIWVLGIFATLLLTLAGYCKLLHTVKTDSQPVTCTALTTYTQKNIAVYRCKTVASPFIFGLWRPTLALPDKELSKEQLDNILRHEMTHLNRNDLWYKWFAVLVRCLHWFNPAVYYVVKQINTECEISCDLSVVKNMNREEELCYINTILSLLTPQSHTMPLTTGMTGSKKSLKQRFTMIKNKKNTTRLMIIASVLIALLLLLMALLASGVLSDLTNKKTPHPQETPIPTAAATLTPELTPEPTAAVTLTPEPTKSPVQTPLTEEEIRWFNEEFFVSSRSTETEFPGTWVRNNLLAQEFDSPAQAHLRNMFHDETSHEINPEAATYLRQIEVLGEYSEYISDEALYRSIFSKSYIEELVQYYLGISLAECEKKEPFKYYSEIDAYYSNSIDAFQNHIKVIGGDRFGDTLTLYYYQTHNPKLTEYTDAELSELPLYAATLKDTGDHYQFLKNERMAVSKPSPTPHPGTPLIEEKIHWFNEEFFVSAHSTETKFPGTWVRNNLLAEEFDNPTQANLNNMFYMESEYINLDEISYLKLETLHDEIGLNRLSADYVNELLQYYLGITLPECENAQLASYYPEVNAFYFKHGDVFANHIKVTEGYRLGDMITLYYHQTLNQNPTDAELSKLPLYVTTLKETGDQYQFLSNKQVTPSSSNTSESEWISVSTKVNGYIAKDVDRWRSDILLPALSYVSRSHYATPRKPGVTHWRINSLEQKAVYAQLSNTKLHLYEVDFYLLAKQPERIEEFDCIRKTPDGWFVTDDTIHHYLIYEEAENGALTHLTTWQEASTPYETGFTDKLKAYLATVLDDGIRDDLVEVYYMDSHVAVVDYVEWVVDDSPRGTYLGVEEQPDGFILYNPVRRFEIYPLAENAVIEIFPPGYGDWIQTTPEECLENCHDTLFHIAIENGKIVHMLEQYTP